MRGIIQVNNYYKKGNKWILESTEERTLFVDRKYWEDCHKYDFSSYHRLTMNGSFMGSYISISPDKKHKIEYYVKQYIHNEEV